MDEPISVLSMHFELRAGVSTLLYRKGRNHILGDAAKIISGLQLERSGFQDLHQTI